MCVPIPQMLNPNRGIDEHREPTSSRPVSYAEQAGAPARCRQGLRGGAHSHGQ
jgi:hypothetical protein